MGYGTLAEVVALAIVHLDFDVVQVLGRLRHHLLRTQDVDVGEGRLGQLDLGRIGPVGSDVFLQPQLCYGGVKVHIGCPYIICQ